MGNIFGLSADFSDISFEEDTLEIPEDSNPIIRAAKAILLSRKTLAITGSGISADSGVPTFRHQNALWEKFNVSEYATLDGFRKDPSKIWQLFLEIHGDGGHKPNEAHLSLAKLQKMNLLGHIFTQNIDNLHQEAGSIDVVEFHGNSREMKCLDCLKIVPLPDLKSIERYPIECPCGGPYKPNCILFGERIPNNVLELAQREVSQCDLLLVIGTSATVFPASEIPGNAKRNGTKVIEINLEKTPITTSVTDLFLQGSASIICQQILEEVERLKKQKHKQ